MTNWKTVLGIIVICGTIAESFNMLKEIEYTPLTIAVAAFSIAFTITIGILLIKWGRQNKKL